MSNKTKYPKKYRFIQDKWEQQCCDKKQENPNPSSVDCVDNWKNNLLIADSRVKKAESQYKKTHSIYTLALSWESNLKKWKEGAEETHEKFIDIYKELIQFIGAVERTEVEKTTISVTAVLCLVKTIYDNMDYLLKEAVIVDEEEIESDLINKLKESIECKPELSANKKEQALECVKIYETKMQDVNKVKEDLLTKLLQTLHDSNELLSAVGSSDKFNGGISEQLEDLSERMCGNRKTPSCGDDESSKDPNPEVPCEEKLIYPSKKSLTINATITSVEQNSIPTCSSTELSVDSDYYKDIVHLFEKAENAKEPAKKAMESDRENHENEKTYYKVLKGAIDASEKARTTN